MRELEFLPEWYPNLRRRRRVLTLQAWITLTIIAALLLWLLLAGRNVRNAEASAMLLESQIRQTQTEQAQLEVQMALKRELTQKEQIIARLGFPVEMSRLLQTLERAMPREMSLTELSCTTELVAPQPAPAQTAQTKADKERPPERRLKVRIAGVAPTDVDLANFMATLQTEYPFFRQLSLLRAGGRSEGGYLMREFEITFHINLDVPGI